MCIHVVLSPAFSIMIITICIYWFYMVYVYFSYTVLCMNLGTLSFIKVPYDMILSFIYLFIYINIFLLFIIFFPSLVFFTIFVNFVI